MRRLKQIEFCNGGKVSLDRGVIGPTEKKFLDFLLESWTLDSLI
jgi:hypothetical protein